MTRKYGGRVAVICERCGHQFTRPASKISAHTYCSRECYADSGTLSENARKAIAVRFPKGGQTVVTCSHCRADVTRFRSQATAARPFCSVRCRRDFAVASAPRQVNSRGYVLIFVGRGAPGADAAGKILEHRLVMQNHLGRALRASENVHHVNGVRDDNRLSNLELWSSSQPPGQRVADKLKWAKEFLRTYEGDPL